MSSPPDWRSMVSDPHPNTERPIHPIRQKAILRRSDAGRWGFMRSISGAKASTTAISEEGQEMRRQGIPQSRFSLRNPESISRTPRLSTTPRKDLATVFHSKWTHSAPHPSRSRVDVQLPLWAILRRKAVRGDPRSDPPRQQIPSGDPFSLPGNGWIGTVHRQTSGPPGRLRRN